MLCIEFGYLMSLTLCACTESESDSESESKSRSPSSFSLFFFIFCLPHLQALITFNLFVLLCFLASLDISAAASFFCLLFSTVFPFFSGLVFVLFFPLLIW